MLTLSPLPAYFFLPPSCSISAMLLSSIGRQLLSQHSSTVVPAASLATLATRGRKPKAASAKNATAAAAPPTGSSAAVTASSPSSAASASPPSANARKTTAPVSPAKTATQVSGSTNSTNATTTASLGASAVSKDPSDHTWKQPAGVQSGVSDALAARTWDAIVIGGGHNGLTSAAYLSKFDRRNVLVLERRHLIGGAAVTEELVPGFKFSRASYVNSLFRPDIIDDLKLSSRYGLTLLPRSPSSFTLTGDGRYLMLGDENTLEEIAKFSKHDAEVFPAYVEQLERIAKFMDPLIQEPPPDLAQGKNPATSFKDWITVGYQLARLGLKTLALGRDFPAAYELMTAPASKILSRWFKGEALKTTLATDAIIGAFTSHSIPGSGYVLFHHVMGETNGQRGVWANVKGGMGSISNTIAACALDYGASICTDAHVDSILTDDSGAATGVKLADGRTISSHMVLSNVGPKTTFESLCPEGSVPQEVLDHMRTWDLNSAVFKINLALDALPNFKVKPNEAPGVPGPQHRGTIHFAQSLEQIDAGYYEAMAGVPSSAPVVEMTLPSVLDPSIAPDGKHVALLFVQYAPYAPKAGPWTQKSKEEFANVCYNIIEEHCPGFKKSIVGADLLAPTDLEDVFSLSGGNIFHGAMGLDQLFWSRPMPGYARHRSPVPNLYLCGAGCHPGGGVQGIPGRNAAYIAGADLSARLKAQARAAETAARQARLSAAAAASKSSSSSSS